MIPTLHQDLQYGRVKAILPQKIRRIQALDEGHKLCFGNKMRKSMKYEYSHVLTHRIANDTREGLGEIVRTRSMEEQ